MSEPVLHYIYDPLCGWCYGAAPLVRAAREVPHLEIVLHGGGMLADANRQPANEALRQFVMEHARRITALSGQVFGDAYLSGLLADARVVLDSTPPTAAVLAVESLGGRPLAVEFLDRLQQAHFVDGRDLGQRAVLIALAAQAGLDAARFEDALDRASDTVAEHIGASRALLARVRGQGFPTFVLEHDGRGERLDHGPHLGDPARWRAELARRTGARVDAGHA